MSRRLCRRCQEIPFDSGLQTLDGTEYRGPREWSLGSFGDLRFRDCPFCQLVASICFQGRSSWDPLTPPEDSTPIDIQFRSAGFTTNCSPIGTHICIVGEPKDSTLTYARIEFPETIDFGDVRRWISACEEHHPTSDCPRPTFNPAILPRNNKRQLDLRLIDVKAMCIVYAPRGCRYVALSYVWGTRARPRLVLTSENEESLMEPGALNNSRIQNSIPPTILDALCAVRKLGEQYLWVDSLCLLQDDENELEECINIMDLFYETAILTIIAASGDAWAGLPGVRTPRQQHQNRQVRRIKQDLKMTKYTDVDYYLRRSIYSSRAWTMQEEILSNRILVFIDNQIFFRCGLLEYSETLNWPGKRLKPSPGSSSLYETIMRSSDVDFMDFDIMISYYMSRDLSFSADILRAAQGMLRKYSILSGIHCFEGLPGPLDRSLLFKPCPRPISRAFGRREEFPSYSWSGWKYAPMYSDKLLHMESVLDDHVFERSRTDLQFNLRGWITWYCKLEDGQFRRIDRSGRLRKSTIPSLKDGQSKSRQSFRKAFVSITDTDIGTIKARAYPLLIFWTICINLRVRELFPEDHEDVKKISNIKEISRNPEPMTQFKAIDRYGENCGTVYTDMAWEADRGQFALIASHREGFYGILLHWTDGIAERRGVAWLFEDALNSCLPPGQRWKSIILK